MNNRGVTLLTVTVIVVVMIIIATTGILAGNKLILNAKELTEEQIVENIKEAVIRKKAEVNMQGTITPIGAGYPGKANPSIGDGSVTATGWYQLDEQELNELGVFETKERVLVNYEYEEVLPMRDPTYFERYNIITFIRDLAKENKLNPATSLIGTPLNDYSNLYYEEKTKEAYGNGWYLVHVEDLPSDYQGKITHNFVANYERGKYVIASGT